MKQELRILIAGVGGQGIHGFVRVLQQEMYTQGYELICARYKGGAQSLGSVHAEIKIFLSAAQASEQQSSQLIPGTIDILLGLERWETLRFLPFCHNQTLIVCDTYTEFPPGTKRQDDLPSIDTYFSRLTNPMISKDFVALAHARGWSKSAVPFLLFNEAIEALGLTTTIQQLKP
jgi:Pyruvate/2-oxoacid:ferredoxin oxidoreductase gamma subunit